METELQGRLARIAYKKRVDSDQLLSEFKGMDPEGEGCVKVSAFKKVLERTVDLSVDDLTKTELKGLIKRFTQTDMHTHAHSCAQAHACTYAHKQPHPRTHAPTHTHTPRFNPADKDGVDYKLFTAWLTVDDNLDGKYTY